VSDGNRVADTAPTAPVEAPWLQARAIVRVVFIALAVAATLWVLYALTSVLLLVVLAIFFAYLLAPLVEFACRPINVRGRARVRIRPVSAPLHCSYSPGNVGAGGVASFLRI
jgi:hypothetical protein